MALVGHRAYPALEPGALAAPSMPCGSAINSSQMAAAADCLRAGGHEDAAECLGTMRTQFQTTMLLLFQKIAYTSTNGEPSIQGSFLRAQKPGQWDSRFTRLTWSHPNPPLASHGAYHSRAVDLSHHCESLCRRLYLSSPSRVVEGLGTYRL